MANNSQNSQKYYQNIGEIKRSRFSLFSRSKSTQCLDVYQKGSSIKMSGVTLSQPENKLFTRSKKPYKKFPSNLPLKAKYMRNKSAERSLLSNPKHIFSKEFQELLKQDHVSALRNLDLSFNCYRFVFDETQKSQNKKERSLSSHKANANFKRNLSIHQCHKEGKRHHLSTKATSTEESKHGCVKLPFLRKKEQLNSENIKILNHNINTEGPMCHLQCDFEPSWKNTIFTKTRGSHKNRHNSKNSALKKAIKKVIGLNDLHFRSKDLLKSLGDAFKSQI
ncbi:unnamed protein product [Moneuplotes crassus]|uniref:Uncharacterized protein n=1 Tax=Euplotes crassus TaxID=5936 RepID=A0AAD1Y7Q5_EUPCR|nr:unnamed protein product [Moneuplotes crassus]